MFGPEVPIFDTAPVLLLLGPWILGNPALFGQAAPLVILLLPNAKAVVIEVTGRSGLNAPPLHSTALHCKGTGYCASPWSSSSESVSSEEDR